MPIGTEWFDVKSEPTLEELISERNSLIKEYEKQLEKLVENHWSFLEDDADVGVEFNQQAQLDFIYVSTKKVEVRWNCFGYSINTSGYIEEREFSKLIRRIDNIRNMNGLEQYIKELENNIQEEGVCTCSYDYDEDYDYICDNCIKEENNKDIKKQLKIVKELKKLLNDIKKETNCLFFLSM